MKTNDGIRTSRRGFLLAVGTAATGAAMGVLPFGAHAAAAAEGAEKIGIIGSGRIGGTLGELWLKSGHEVMFSSLDIEHDKALAARLGGKARAGTTKEAAAFGDVVLVAVPYSAMPQLGKDLADTLKGKTIIDTSNPILARDGDIAKWAREKGAGLASAELLPGTRIVRERDAEGRYSRRARQDGGHRPAAGKLRRRSGKSKSRIQSVLRKRREPAHHQRQPESCPSLCRARPRCVRPL